MKFIVNESKWFRGKGPTASKLLNEEGKMCCLGFVGLQCGLSEDDILGIASPEDASFRANPVMDKYPDWIFRYGYDSRAALNLMKINDSTILNDEERKKKIQEIFIQNGDEILFVKE